MIVVKDELSYGIFFLKYISYKICFIGQICCLEEKENGATAKKDAQKTEKIVLSGRKSIQEAWKSGNYLVGFLLICY